MKKYILLAVLFVSLTACGRTPLPSTPTVVNIYPTPLPTPTLAVVTSPITDQEDAFHFFYEIKNMMALGEYEHFAEEIRYPITVNINGKSKTFVYVAEFEVNFEDIFNEDVIKRFISIDESELTFTENGVKVADGIIWFDLVCMDPECGDAEFLITEVNN